ncbi:MAG TPA: glycosyltransferase family 2 protein [Planctomycetota bacterium]|nr:glycosyltransferase family 2 protein [Planctomycetota bacterium]
MNGEPVTVVVVNHQGERHLPSTLPAIAALEGPVAERILVDSGSEDASLRIVRERFPQFRVIALGSNRGPAAARNRALAEAKTRLLLTFDNDVVPEADCLRRLLEAWRSGVVAAAPRAILDADRSRIHYDGAWFHYAGLFALRHFYAPLDPAAAGGAVEVDGAIALALLLDREAALAAGGFEEGYFILFEDQDLCYRLRASGGTILSVPGARVLHRAGTEGFSLRPGTGYAERRTFLHARNRWLFLMRNYRPRTAFAALPGLLLYEALSFGFALRNGHAAAYLRGKAEALRARAAARAAREALERRRVLPDRSLLRGRPLTITPSLRKGWLRGLLFRAVEEALAAWWGIGRRLAG